MYKIWSDLKEKKCYRRVINVERGKWKNKNKIGIKSSKKLFQKVDAVSLACYWDSHEMLMLLLLMASQIMHPSNGVLTVCVHM
jgi:hypothetical protein